MECLYLGKGKFPSNHKKGRAVADPAFLMTKEVTGSLSFKLPSKPQEAQQAGAHEQKGGR